jgi:hypothetical protein
MSEKKEQRFVQINENNLVDLIDNIVKEAVSQKKKQWVSEQKKNINSKTALLESRVAKLEKLFTNAKIVKKSK